MDDIFECLNFTYRIRAEEIKESKTFKQPGYGRIRDYLYIPNEPDYLITNYNPF